MAHFRTTLTKLTAPALVLLLASACTAPRVRPALALTPPPKMPSLIGRANRLGQTLLGRSVEDRPINGHVFGSGNDSILIMATIHGNEWAGTPLLMRLADHLATHPELVRGRRVVLIPVVNPDGYDRRLRYNANRIDLNRNFPAGNRSNNHRNGKRALSEPESRAIHEAIQRYRPDRIVSIHQPVGCLDYDGPASALARAMADASGMKVRRLGTRPGSLGSYAGNTLGIPTITLELPGRATRLDEDGLWEEYGPMLLAAISAEDSSTK